MATTITKDINIKELLDINEGVADVLFASGMHCLGCVMAHGESLAEAAAVHGIDIDELVTHINEYLAENEK